MNRWFAKLSKFYASEKFNYYLALLKMRFNYWCCLYPLNLRLSCHRQISVQYYFLIFSGWWAFYHHFRVNQSSVQHSARFPLQTLETSITVIFHHSLFDDYQCLHFFALLIPEWECEIGSALSMSYWQYLQITVSILITLRRFCSKQPCIVNNYIESSLSRSSFPSIPSM